MAGTGQGESTPQVSQVKRQTKADIRASNFRDVNRIKLAAMQDEGLIPKSVDANMVPDAEVADHLRAGHLKYLAETGRESILPEKYTARPPTMPAKAPNALDNYVFDPQQPGHRLQRLAQSFQDMHVGRENYVDNTYSRFAGLEKLSQRAQTAIFHVLDMSPTPEDTRLAAPHAELVEGLKDLFTQARQDPDIAMSGVIHRGAGGEAGGYITRAGVYPKGLTEAFLDHEMGADASQVQRSLQMMREKPEIARQFTSSVNMPGLVRYYLGQLWEAKNLPDYKKQFDTGLRKFAEQYPTSAKEIQSFYDRNFGREQSAFDASLKSLLHDTFVDNRVAKAAGISLEDAHKGTGVFKLIGKAPWVGEPLTRQFIEMVSSQKPSNKIISLGNSMAATYGVGLNPASVVKHWLGDGLRAFSNNTPGEIAEAFYHGVLKKSPELMKRLQEQRVIDPGFSLENVTGVNSPMGGASKIATTLIRRTDNLFKAMVYHIGEQRGLAMGKDLETASRMGRDTVFALQNAFGPANTSNAMAHPIARALFLFGRTPKAMFTSPFANLRAGDWQSSAKFAGGIAATYLAFKAYGNYNVLPSMVHPPLVKGVPVPPALAMGADVASGLKSAASGDAETAKKKLIPPGIKRYKRALEGEPPMESLAGMKKGSDRSGWEGFLDDIKAIYSKH